MILLPHVLFSSSVADTTPMVNIFYRARGASCETLCRGVGLVALTLPCWEPAAHFRRLASYHFSSRACCAFGMFFGALHRVTQCQELEGTSKGQPNPLLKQEHLDQVTQEHIQVGFGCLQRGRPHNLSGQPVPVFRHPYYEEVFSHIYVEPPMLHLVPIAPCPVIGCH